jgi:enoyl-[acyl-carrier-protein] reductase (NADH)
MLLRKVVVNTYTKTAINVALEAVTKVLAKELSPVRVNAVSTVLTMKSAYKGWMLLVVMQCFPMQPLTFQPEE